MSPPEGRSGSSNVSPCSDTVCSPDRLLADSGGPVGCFARAAENAVAAAWPIQGKSKIVDKNARRAASVIIPIDRQMYRPHRSRKSCTADNPSKVHQLMLTNFYALSQI